MDGRPDLQEEISTGCRKQHGVREHQEACLAVLPGEDGALPYRAVPPVDEEPPHRSVLIVPIPDANAGAPFEGVFGMEGPAEGLMGGS